MWWDPPPEVVAARLDAYRGGWLEWLWRSLTYRMRQPMRLETA
jgi:uncharacterized membrane protein YeiB